MERQRGQKRQRSISDFFKYPKPKVDKPNEEVNTDIENKQSPIIDSEAGRSQNQETSENIEIDTYVDTKDISHFIGGHLSSSDIIDVLENAWVPSQSYNFPVTTHKQNKNVKNLKFQHSWITRWPWILYSAKEDGVYCKFCCLFAKSGAGVNSQELGSLVKKKFCNWKRATEVFKNHSNLKYHLQCLADADNFIKVSKNINISIENQLDTSRKQVIENRENIKPIIEGIILCGRQELALRGHRDAGELVINETAHHNEGNFRAILRYRATGDDHLKNFLEGPGKRNKYISPVSQNAIIDACNNVLLKKIVNSVNRSNCFSVLADETADISGVEQVSVCVRYVDTDKLILKEDFLQFVPTVDVTGKGLATLILESLKSFGINTTYLRGQGYDGAASMSGQFNGVQTHIKTVHPLAYYVHCSAHILNLAVSRACEVQSIRNCIGIVGKIHDFFIYPKRKAILNENIHEMAVDAHARTLKRNCATRWIERYHSINDFIELIESVISSLDAITQWKDAETARNAVILRAALVQSDFLISLYVIGKVFSVTLPLSKHFQSSSIDLKEAIGLADITLKELEDYRINSKSKFKRIYEDALRLAKILDTQITVPRLTARQKHKSNLQVETNSTEDYFRITIFCSFLDLFINQIKDRFLNHKDLLKGFQTLLPQSGAADQKDEFRLLVNIYEKDLSTCKEDAISEYSLWRKKILNMDEKPKNAMNALVECNPNIFPNIFRLLQLLATLPVSTATSERSFSTLKRIKTYLRNSMSEGRMNGLSMLTIHRNIDISTSEVIDELAKNPRRLDFVI